MQARGAQTSSPVLPAQGDTYEQVRLSFLARLRSEATQLAALSTALMNSEHDSVAVFSDIGEFAHRLRGAAAVFEEFRLSDSAKVLEHAALAALAGPPGNKDPALASALRGLAVQLALVPQEPQG